MHDVYDACGVHCVTCMRVKCLLFVVFDVRCVMCSFMLQFVRIVACDTVFACYEVLHICCIYCVVCCVLCVVCCVYATFGGVCVVVCVLCVLCCSLYVV